MADKKRIVLVTGGNTGLGLEIVRALAKSSNTYEIIIGCRTVSSGEKAVKTVQSEVDTPSTFSVIQVDLESDDSLENAINEIAQKHNKLDILVNNAGAQFDAQIVQGKMTVREAFNKSWDVNVSGTHVLTMHAVPLLLKSDDPRMLFLTSGTAPLTETEFTEKDGPIYARLNASPPAGWPKPPTAMGVPAYRSVKTGLNMLMRDWVRLLRNDSVKIWSISPGMLATGLGGFGPDKLREVSKNIHSRTEWS